MSGSTWTRHLPRRRTVPLRARVLYDGTDASWPGLEAAWPKDARAGVHVPRGANAAAFVQRVLPHAEAGAPVVVLTENRTHLPWAQSLLAAAAAVCFIDATVERPRTDDPRVVEVEEAPSAAAQGHLLVGLKGRKSAGEKHLTRFENARHSPYIRHYWLLIQFLGLRPWTQSCSKTKEVPVNVSSVSIY